MPWVKRNLLLVAGGLVALGLLGFAGYFLFAKIQTETEVTRLLEEQTAELERLTKLDPHPGNEKVDNIKEAKKQDQQLQEFLKRARERFVPMDYPKGLDGGQFRLLLDNTIDELRRAAERAGVKLPNQYAFTFAAQKPLMAFDQPTIEPLARMLTDVRTIAHILFQAKIISLDGMRRIAVAAQDTPSPTPGQSDYWNKKPTTNDLAVTTPYEVVFHAFTPELAAVLEGLYRSPHCLLVKNLTVDTGPVGTEEGQGGEGGAPMSIPGLPPGMTAAQLQMLMRYGRLPGRMSMPPPPPPPTDQAAQPGTGRGGMTAMLDEKPFRVVMWIEVVRLKDLNKEKEPRPGRTQPARTATPAPDPAATP